MKSFLIPIGGSETDESLFATALAAARPFASHMNFFHVHIGPGQAAANEPHTTFAMGPALSNALKDLEIKAQVRSTLAAQHFHEFCARSRVEICDTPGLTKGVTASWHEQDLVVLGAYGRSRMHEILFGSCTQSMIRNAETSVLVMH